MSTVSASPRRHALGLPAGGGPSGSCPGGRRSCLRPILYPTDTLVAIPPYLVWLLFLMVGHYFAAHGVSIATRTIPHRPPVPAGRHGACARHRRPGRLRRLETLSGSGRSGRQFEGRWTSSKAAVVAAGHLGLFLARRDRSLDDRPGSPSPGLQDFEAWISLIALLAMSSPR